MSLARQATFFDKNSGVGRLSPSWVLRVRVLRLKRPGSESKTRGDVDPSSQAMLSPPTPSKHQHRDAKTETKAPAIYRPQFSRVNSE